MSLDSDERAMLERFARPAINNWNGMDVGRLQPTAALLPK